MLVYLDSAHLALLQRASPDDVSTFLSTWVESGCELVLSIHHLQEIAQLADRESVKRRLEVLRNFPLIRYGSASSDLVLRFEIQIQCFELLGYKPDVRASAVSKLFPEANFDHLCSATLALRPIFKLMQGAYVTGADAENASKLATQQARPVSMRRQIDPSLLNSHAFNQSFQGAIAGMPSPVVSLMRWIGKRVTASIRKFGNVRQALEWIYKLDNVEMRNEILDGDLAAVSTFFKSARKEVDDLFALAGADTSTSEQLVRRLNPYRAPGFALRLAVLRARKRHPKADQPGDQIDSDHVCFAPYVDVLFVDKRTLGFAMQEYRDNRALIPSHGISRIEKAGTLEQVTAIIASRTRVS
jgi:hypothetical protein